MKIYKDSLLIIVSIFFIFLFIFYGKARATIELDADNNGAVDVVYGGTNAVTPSAARNNMGVPSVNDMSNSLNSKQNILSEYSQSAVEAGTSSAKGIMTPRRSNQAMASYLAKKFGFGDFLGIEPTTEETGDLIWWKGYTAAGVNGDPNNLHGETPPFNDPYLTVCVAAGSPGTYQELGRLSNGKFSWTYSNANMAIDVKQGSVLNDTSSPHTLLTSEMKNKLITNAGATGPEEYDAPAYTTAAGWNVTFLCEAAQNMTIDTNGTERWYLNEAQLSAGEDIVNTSCAAGESVTCIGGLNTVYCKSDHFTEAVP